MMNTHAARLSQFQKLIADKGFDAFLVTRPLDQYFLTGYHMNDYLLLVGRKKAWAMLPEMLCAQFRDIVSFCKAEATSVGNDVPTLALKRVEAEGFSRVAFDMSAETYISGTMWKKHKFVPSENLSLRLRLTKQGTEIESLRKSCRVAAKAFEVIRKKVRPGQTERQVMLTLERIMQDMGASGPSFNTIIGSGPNSALPHHITGDRKLRAGEPLLLDFGCVYDHYCSDITRTIFLGKPTPEFRRVYSIVEASHDAGVKAVRSGIPCKAVDDVCRGLITDAGYGKTFMHGTGHGVGLEIHEPPRLNTKDPSMLMAGMAVTVEPGIYLHGKFGVRIEDTVLVKEKGCEILTRP